MTATARLLQTARRILEEAGRPLSVRRILRAGQESAAFEGDGPDLDALKAALDAGVTDGVVVQMRRGVFSVAPAAAAEASAPAAPEPAEPEPAPAAPEPAAAAPAPAKGAEDEPEGGRRRRRRRRGRNPERPVAPTSLEETAELSAGASDRDALKGKMWARLKARAAEVTDQPAAPDAPAEGAEPKAAEEQPRRRRERGPRRENDGEKPRRRRRRRSEEPAAAAPEAATAPTEAPTEAPAEDGSPRDALKAKLARRRRPSKTAEAAPPAPAAETPAPVEKPRRGGRDQLKARLAARARGGTDAPKPAEAAPAAEAPAPTRPAANAAPADGGDPRSRLKARLTRRSRGESAPRAESAPVAEATPAESKPAAPARSERGADPRSRLKARLAARTAGQETADAPAAAAAAPVAPKAPAKPAQSGSGDGLTGRAALKARLAARAGRPAAAPVEPVEQTAETAAPAPKAEPKDASSTGTPRDALKNRLGRRGEAPAKAPAAQAAPAAEKASGGRGSARDALKARLAARRGPSTETKAVEPAAAPAAPAETKTSSLDVPLAPTRRPYKERRRREKAPPRERRNPSLPELKATSALVSTALEALRSAGGPMALDALVGAVSEAGGAHGLRAALLAENARCARVGLRAPFVLHYGGLIGLTEWGLSDRYRALEAQIQEALAEQRELMRRDLLSRIGDLDDGPFEQVVALLLERLGHFGARVVHRQAGTVAMTVQRAVGESTETIAVIARRSWSPIKDGTVRRLRDMLGAFGADAGLLMTVGTFATSARSEAFAEGSAPIRLIDGAGLAGLLHDHGIGLTTHQPVIRHVDSAFFESLGT